METKKYDLKIKFITPVLGTQPQKNIAVEFLSKHYEEDIDLPEDELGTLEENLEKGTTAFHKLNEKPILYDYQVKGFIKEAGRVLNGLRDVRALRSKIDSLVFVEPRQILLMLPNGAGIDFLERPLRAQTMQGPRVAIARSEMLPAGTEFSCQLKVYPGPISKLLLEDLLSYGFDKGIGQWRNGGYGRFEFDLK
jgi:hypothetical protein